ncbi:integrase core domain-containing protein [Prevotella cerevisiae]|uniref:Integrase core domain-containing protein n=1 Tax=Segatella cerevisiae TaxID=2053716 RepID=A0ABT1BZR8_9BACT|nr:integrase core domain-containing protein [Segatella cerevisiae]MCO6026479.1 integrase core domain-containing protein [Segatella cerevisiae]
MTESGDPKDNIIAERLNETLKDELFKGLVFRNIEEVRQAIQKGNIKHSARSCNVPSLTGKIPNNHHRLNSIISKTDQEQAENQSVPFSFPPVPSSFPVRSLFGFLVDKTVVAIC